MNLNIIIYILKYKYHRAQAFKKFKKFQLIIK